MRLVRVFFQKIDRGIYISHLDLNKAMQRSIKRSGVPVWYTMGYNPHMYMTFAMPLSLGFEGLRESMDIKVLDGCTNNQVKEMLSEALPPCIKMVTVNDAVMEPKDIEWADYRIVFELDDDNAKDARNSFETFISQKEILVEKKTKKGILQVDILPLFTVLDITDARDELIVNIRAASGISLNMNPTLLINAFSNSGYAGVQGSRVTRTDILTKDFKQFI